MWVFRVAFGYVFALESIKLFDILSFSGLALGAIGVWLAMIVDWIFRASLFLIRYLSGKWLRVYKSS